MMMMMMMMMLMMRMMMMIVMMTWRLTILAASEQVGDKKDIWGHVSGGRELLLKL